MWHLFQVAFFLGFFWYFVFYLDGPDPTKQEAAGLVIIDGVLTFVLSYLLGALIDVCKKLFWWFSRVPEVAVPKIDPTGPTKFTPGALARRPEPLVPEPLLGKVIEHDPWRPNALSYPRRRRTSK